MLFAALLLASVATPEVPFAADPDFELQLNEATIPIYCSENPEELTKLFGLQKQTDQKAKPLRGKRKRGTMTLPESALLYGYDLTLVALSLGIATREHAGFLCTHPEQWPKVEKEPAAELPAATT